MSCPEINPRFLLPDEVWERVSHVMPADRPKPKGGRPRMDNRQALNAIFYVLRTGCQWNAIPRSLGASSTVHDRLSQGCTNFRAAHHINGLMLTNI